jgi:hypothetical protein
VLDCEVRHFFIVAAWTRRENLAVRKRFERLDAELGGAETLRVLSLREHRHGRVLVAGNDAK